MRKINYFYGFAAFSLLAGGGVAAYAALAESPQVTQNAPKATEWLKPNKADLDAEYVINVAEGTSSVKIKITAPSTARDTGWNEYDIEGVDRIELYRAYESEDAVFLKAWDNVSKGTLLAYEDKEILKPGDYSYNVRSILNDIKSDNTYAEVTYGINPIDPDYPVVTAISGQPPVTVSYACPEAQYGSFVDPTPFPEGVNYSEIRLFKYDSAGNEVVLRSDADPTPGQTFEYIDENPVDGMNYYYVRTYTDFGYSNPIQGRVFIGPDCPGKVKNVVAVESAGKVIVTWDAPTEGIHKGFLDPNTLMYKIYRVDNDYFQNPTLLADDLTECKFIDNLEGLTEETLLYYRVFPYNDIPLPANEINYCETEYGVLAGPAAQLPFSENFNAGSKLNHTFQNKWEEEFNNYAFNSHYIRDNVTIENIGKEQDIKCGVDGPGTKETGPDNFYLITSGNYTSSISPGYLTTPNISFADITNPILSFWYVPVAGSKGCLRVQMSTGEYDHAGFPIYEVVYTQPYGELPSGEEVDSESTFEWTRVSVPLTQIAGRQASKLRLAFNYEDPSEGRFPMLFDQVEINDYPAASDIVLSPENGKILLSWNLPESAAGKKAVFSILLNDEVIAETEETSYVYEGAEQGDEYEFCIATKYADGVEAPLAVSEKITIPITDFTINGFYYVVYENNTASLQEFVGEETEVVIPSEVTYKNSSFKINHMLPQIFSGNRSLKSIDLQAELEAVPDRLCYGCVALESVKLPVTITSVGSQSFFGCVSLENMDLPESVALIEKGAFENCLNLLEISFSQNLQEIEDQAFMRCQSLSKVTFAGSVPPKVGKDAFKDISDDCIGICPEGSENAYNAVDELKPIKFPTSGVEKVDMENVVDIQFFNLSGVRIMKPVHGETVITHLRYSDGTVKVLKLIYP